MVWKSKNHPDCTFGTLSPNLSILRECYLLYAIDIALNSYWNVHNIFKSILQIFDNLQSEERHSQKSLFEGLTCICAFEIEKSPIVDVWDHRSSSKHHTITSFVSAHRCDSKQPLKNSQCFSKTFSKIFR